MMKRSRLVAFCATLILLAGTTLAGGISLRGGSAHADSGMAPDQVAFDALRNYHLAHGNLPALKHQNGHTAQGISGIDTIPNFNGKYLADGFAPTGNPNKQ